MVIAKHYFLLLTKSELAVGVDGQVIPPFIAIIVFFRIANHPPETTKCGYYASNMKMFLDPTIVGITMITAATWPRANKKASSQ